MNNEQTQLAIHELEEQFFKTFGINKQCMCPYFPEYKENGCEICIKYFQGKKDCNDKNQYNYPNITSGKLLQLLCIVIDEYNRNGHTFYLDSTNIEELKEEILDALIGCIDASCDLFEIQVKQIQKLFKD